METIEDAMKVMLKVWPKISYECRRVLGSELHYQAMMYRIFRDIGKVPAKEIGMNVKIRIMNPRVAEFVARDNRKHEDFQGGYEPIPDIVLFSREINGNFQRRNRKKTLAHMLMAIEVKASEREEGRIRPGEIINDLKKLDAFKKEAAMRKSVFVPTMVILDTAHDKKERMNPNSLNAVFVESEKLNIGLFYCSHVSRLDRVFEWDYTRFKK